MNRKQLFNILKIVISIVLLALIFSSIDLPAFWQIIQQANPWWLLAAVGVMMLGVGVRAWRWQILLDAIGVHVPLSELTAIYFIGFLFNNLLPSGLGGDAIRMVELNRHTERGSDAVTSVVVDRYLGLLALQAIALVTLLLSWGSVPAFVAGITIVIFVAGMVIGYLLVNRSLYLRLQQRSNLFRRLSGVQFVGNLFESFHRYPLPAIGRSFLVSFLFNFTLIAVYAFIGWSLAAPVSLAQFAIIVPITSMFLLLPISFGGLGVREWAFQAFYRPIGVSPEVAVAMSLLVYFIGNVCTGIIGGIIYLIRSARGVVTERTQP